MSVGTDGAMAQCPEVLRRIPPRCLRDLGTAPLRTPMGYVSCSSGSSPRAAIAATCASRSSTKSVTTQLLCCQRAPQRRPTGPRQASIPPRRRGERTTARQAAGRTRAAPLESPARADREEVLGHHRESMSCGRSDTRFIPGEPAPDGFMIELANQGVWTAPRRHARTSASGPPMTEAEARATQPPGRPSRCDVISPLPRRGHPDFRVEWANWF